MTMVFGAVGSPSAPGTAVGAPVMASVDDAAGRQPAEACGTISHCQRALGVAKRYTLGVSVTM